MRKQKASRAKDKQPIGVFDSGLGGLTVVKALRRELPGEDVVYFGEPIPADVSSASEQEAFKCDLMLVCGTSAVVYPFADLPVIASGKGRSTLESFLNFGLKPNIPAVIIEINSEPTPLTFAGVSDYLIQGKTGEILPQIVTAVQAGI